MPTAQTAHIQMAHLHTARCKAVQARNRQASLMPAAPAHSMGRIAEHVCVLATFAVRRRVCLEHVREQQYSVPPQHVALTQPSSQLGCASTVPLPGFSARYQQQRQQLAAAAVVVARCRCFACCQCHSGVHTVGTALHCTSKPHLYTCQCWHLHGWCWLQQLFHQLLPYDGI